MENKNELEVSEYNKFLDIIYALQCFLSSIKDSNLGRQLAIVNTNLEDILYVALESRKTLFKDHELHVSKLTIPVLQEQPNTILEDCVEIICKEAFANRILNLGSEEQKYVADKAIAIKSRLAVNGLIPF